VHFWLYCVKSRTTNECSTFRVPTVDHAVPWRDLPSAGNQNTSTVRPGKLNLKTATRGQEYSPPILWCPQACAVGEGRWSKSLSGNVGNGRRVGDNITTGLSHIDHKLPTVYWYIIQDIYCYTMWLLTDSCTMTQVLYYRAKIYLVIYLVLTTFQIVVHLLDSITFLNLRHSTFRR